MFILCNCDPKVLIEAVNDLEEKYKVYHENFQKVIIKENREVKKTWYRKGFVRTDEEALAHGKKLYDNIKTQEKFDRAFTVFKYFREDMEIAAKCNAVVNLEKGDDIFQYIRKGNFK